MSIPRRVTQSSAAESGIVFVKNSITNVAERIGFTSEVQVGLPEKPRELQVIGSVIYTSRTIQIENGGSVSLEKNSTYFLIDPLGASGAVTVYLPRNPKKGQLFVIKDYLGKSHAVNIVVRSYNSEHTIEGQTTKTINARYGSIEVFWNGTEWSIPQGSTSRSIITFGASSVALSATRYLRPGSAHTTGATTSINIATPTKGTLRNLCVLHNTAGVSGGADNQLEYTVVVNGVDTAITTSLVCTSTDASLDSVNTSSVEIGDKISIKVVCGTDVSTSPGSIIATFEIVS